MIRFQCTCGKRLKVDDTSAGRKVKCSTCGKEMIAPAVSQAAGGDLDALAQAMQSAVPKAANGAAAVKMPIKPNGGPQAKTKPGAAKSNNTPLYIGLGVAGGVLLIIFIVIAVVANSGGEPVRPKPTPVITPESSVKPTRGHIKGELFPNVEPQN